MKPDSSHTATTIYEYVSSLHPKADKFNWNFVLSWQCLFQLLLYYPAASEFEVTKDHLPSSCKLERDPRS